MRAARIRSHPPLPCILSDWQPSDQNLHPSSSRKNPVSGEWRLRKPEKPRGKSSLIRPNQSLVFTAYGRGGWGGGASSSSSSRRSDGVKRQAGPVRRWVRLGVWNKNIEKWNKFDFTGVFFCCLAPGATVVQYVPRFRQRISAKLPSLRVAAANK